MQNVVPVYEEFVSRFPSARRLSEATEEEILEVIRPLGLPWRVKYLKKLGLELAQRDIPESREELLKLPCVGDYVASAYFSLHGKRRELLIDTNTVRWACRVLGRDKDGETRRKKWVRDFFELLTPQSGWMVFNYAILDFSMIVCGKTPDCKICILKDICATGRIYYET